MALEDTRAGAPGSCTRPAVTGPPMAAPTARPRKRRRSSRPIGGRGGRGSGRACGVGGVGGVRGRSRGGAAPVVCCAAGGRGRWSVTASPTQVEAGDAGHQDQPGDERVPPADRRAAACRPRRSGCPASAAGGATPRPRKLGRPRRTRRWRAPGSTCTPTAGRRWRRPRRPGSPGSLTPMTAQARRRSPPAAPPASAARATRAKNGTNPMARQTASAVPCAIVIGPHLDWRRRRSGRSMQHHQDERRHHLRGLQHAHHDVVGPPAVRASAATRPSGTAISTAERRRGTLITARSRRRTRCGRRGRGRGCRCRTGWATVAPRRGEQPVGPPGRWDRRETGRHATASQRRSRGGPHRSPDPADEPARRSGAAGATPRSRRLMRHRLP